MSYLYRSIPFTQLLPGNGILLRKSFLIFEKHKQKIIFGNKSEKSALRCHSDTRLTKGMSTEQKDKKIEKPNSQNSDGKSSQTSREPVITPDQRKVPQYIYRTNDYPESDPGYDIHPQKGNYPNYHSGYLKAQILGIGGD